jgi:hypothetical protein
VQMFFRRRVAGGAGDEMDNEGLTFVGRGHGPVRRQLGSAGLRHSRERHHTVS